MSLCIETIGLHLKYQGMCFVATKKLLSPFLSWNMVASQYAFHYSVWIDTKNISTSLNSLPWKEHCRFDCEGPLISASV